MNRRSGHSPKQFTHSVVTPAGTQRKLPFTRPGIQYPQGILLLLTQTNIVRVMAYIGTSVEYALHCLLWLAEPLCESPSSRELAELQGISPSFVAKILPKLEKAGIVSASDGIRGGYWLARSPGQITVLEVIDAVEGKKPLFECQEIRGRCAVFDGKPPGWAVGGTCGIHAVMIRAENILRSELARTTLAVLVAGVRHKAPSEFAFDIQKWLSDRATARDESRLSALKHRPRAKGRRATR
jgi:Rrf2 family protein